MTISGKQAELLLQRFQIGWEEAANAMGMPESQFRHLLYGILTPENTQRILDVVVSIKGDKFDSNRDLGEKLSHEDGLLSTIMYYDSVPCSDAAFTMDDHIKIFNWLSELKMYRQIGLLAEVEKVRSKNEQNVDQGN